MFQTLSLAGILLAASLLPGQLQQPQATEYPSRAEVVMSLVLTRVPNVPVVRNTGRFPDVPKGIWHETFTLYAEQNGIIRADAQTGELRMDESVTRAEFLKMLTVTFDLPVGYAHPFTDVPHGIWFEPYAGLAQQYPLFIRTSRTLLEPQRIVTRQEMTDALKIFERLQNGASVRLEQDIAQEQSQDNLQLYTVISTRQQKTVFVDPPPLAVRTPYVRTIRLPLSLPDLRLQILTMVNAIRLERRLKPLTANMQLEASAQEYADRMIEEGFFGHVSPEGQVLKDRVSATGYYDRSFSIECACVKGYALGENLARGQKTPKEVVEAWMKSPSHRDAIINPDYTDIGIGARAGIWVQHFGGVLLPGMK